MPFMNQRQTVIAAAFSVFTLAPDVWAQKVTVDHGIAMHGDIKYKGDFKHFDYADPNAPKGGDVKRSAIGTFDNLNPFVLKGVSAAGIGGLFETLMVGSDDEAFSGYCQLCETVEVPEDRSWVAFTMRAEAKFSDGSPLTIDDVIWTLDTIKTKGHPFYQSYYADVVKAEKTGDRKVRFTFRPGENRELPLIVGQLPILSKAYWSTREFDKSTLEPPLGSGPYRVESFEPGRYITYSLRPDYWGAKLPVRLGQINWGTVRYDYYRDAIVALEAFKAGEYDLREENVARNWATGYDIPALKTGVMKKEEFRHQRTAGMQGFTFNTRSAIFQDRRVREALSYAFDFELSNKNFFFGAYTRTKSYFDNSELASRGLPAGEELKILERFKGKVPDEVFTKEFKVPVTDGTGNIRDNLREGTRLLQQAGWVVRNGKLVHGQTNQPMEFEILLSDVVWERIALAYVENLERLGITAKVRTIDTAQYQKRMEEFDFDLTVSVFGQSQSPGNEQRDFWTAAKADVKGSRNVIGIKDPVVDSLVDLVISAPDRDTLVQRTRALDRVLLWGHYLVPHWHINVDRVASWDKFQRPQTQPTNGVELPTWWVDSVKAATLSQRKLLQ